MKGGGDSPPTLVDFVEVVEAADRFVLRSDTVAGDFRGAGFALLAAEGVGAGFFAAGRAGFLKRPFTEGLCEIVRVDKVLDPFRGDSGAATGSSSVGVVERGRRKPGTAILDLERSRKPDVEGVRSVPNPRPRAGELSTGGNCGLKGFDKS